jgi:uncharacterized protein
MDQAIIIFVRNPVLGKVKSRLATSVGKKNALKIYNWLLDHTCKISKNLSTDKFVFYEDFINYDDIWDNAIYRKKLQEGNGLGKRMKNAFKYLFDAGYRKIIIIGSDCYELTSKIIEDAFDTFSKNDVVIGPALDGGYYLLGMDDFIPELFENKKWGSDTVFADTVSQVKKLDYSLNVLVQLKDVDVESDIDFNKLKEISNTS